MTRDTAWHRPWGSRTRRKNRKAEVLAFDQCPSCGAASLSGVPTVQRNDGSVLILCCNCGVLYLRGLSPELLTVYDQHYYERGRVNGPVGTGYHAYEITTTPTDMWWIAEIIRALVPQRGRLLDIGCATGSLMDIARWCGFAVTGVDISPGASVGSARGLDVRIGDVCDVALDGSFNAVTAMEVLEHLLDVPRFLRRVHELLVPVGIFVFFVPGIDKRRAFAEGPEYPSFQDTFEHTLYFDRPAAQNLVDSWFGTGSGLVLEQRGLYAPTLLGIVRSGGLTSFDNRFLEVLAGVTLPNETPTPWLLAAALNASKHYRYDEALAFLDQARCYASPEVELAAAVVELNQGHLFKSRELALSMARASEPGAPVWGLLAKLEHSIAEYWQSQSTGEQRVP